MNHKDGYMSKNGTPSPAGLGQRRIWVGIVTVLVVAALASATAAVIRGMKSPESRQQADVERSELPIPAGSTTPTSPPNSSPTPTATTSAAAAQSTGAGQPASAPKPRITSFSATANGLIVTVTFTLEAQADRGPFTCSIRRAAVGTEEFPCTIGQVSRTYDYDYCCGGEVHIIATDRHGVRSDQWNGSVDFPKPEPPTYSNLRGWHDGSMVHIAFDVTSAPGDDPRCEIYISKISPSIERQWDGVPCTDSAEVSLPGPSGNYTVTITIRSDSHWYPGPPPLETVH
ncbi:MAG: hypothetical protein IRY92_10365, partial [Dactylosporangium sp.]|nr:hypothetical protein [Dactylosporangium sp.]